MIGQNNVKGQTPSDGKTHHLSSKVFSPQGPLPDGGHTRWYAVHSEKLTFRSIIAKAT